MNEVPDYGEFATQAPTDAELKSVGDLGSDLYMAMLDMLEKQAALKRAQELVLLLSEKHIPEAMAKIGMKEFTLANGLKLTVEPKVRANIPAEQKNEACDWLEKHGHGGIVKRCISVEFGREEQRAAEKLLAELRKKFPSTKAEKWVEPMTLGKFVRDQIEEKKLEELPKNLFSVHQFEQAKINESKKGKKSVFEGE